MQSINIILVAFVMASCLPVMLLFLSAYTLYNTITMAQVAKRRNEKLFKALTMARTETKSLKSISPKATQSRKSIFISPKSSMSNKSVKSAKTTAFSSEVQFFPSGMAQSSPKPVDSLQVQPREGILKTRSPANVSAFSRNRPKGIQFHTKTESTPSPIDGSLFPLATRPSTYKSLTKQPNPKVRPELSTYV